MAERLLKEIMGKADFDMEEYDKAMAAAFDDQYYEVFSLFLPTTATNGTPGNRLQTCCSACQYLSLVKAELL